MGDLISLFPPGSTLDEGMLMVAGCRADDQHALVQFAAGGEQRDQVAHVYWVLARISRTRSMLVSGWRKTRRPTVSPSHLLGGTNATPSTCSFAAHWS